MDEAETVLTYITFLQSLSVIILCFFVVKKEDFVMVLVVWLRGCMLNQV